MSPYLRYLLPCVAALLTANTAVANQVMRRAAIPSPTPPPKPLAPRDDPSNPSDPTITQASYIHMGPTYLYGATMLDSYTYVGNKGHTLTGVHTMVVPHATPSAGEYVTQNFTDVVDRSEHIGVWVAYATPPTTYSFTGSLGEGITTIVTDQAISTWYVNIDSVPGTLSYSTTTTIPGRTDLQTAFVVAVATPTSSSLSRQTQLATAGPPGGTIDYPIDLNANRGTAVLGTVPGHTQTTFTISTQIGTGPIENGVMVLDLWVTGPTTVSTTTPPVEVATTITPTQSWSSVIPITLGQGSARTVLQYTLITDMTQSETEIYVTETIVGTPTTIGIVQVSSSIVVPAVTTGFSASAILLETLRTDIPPTIIPTQITITPTQDGSSVIPITLGTGVAQTVAEYTLLAGLTDSSTTFLFTETIGGVQTTLEVVQLPSVIQSVPPPQTTSLFTPQTTIPETGVPTVTLTDTNNFGLPINVPSSALSGSETATTVITTYDYLGVTKTLGYVITQASAPETSISAVTGRPLNIIALKTGAFVTEHDSTLTLPASPTNITTSATWKYGTESFDGLMTLMVLADPVSV